MQLTALAPSTESDDVDFQVPPDTTMALPRTSVATHEADDTHEIAVSTVEGSAETLDAKAPFTSVMIEPSSVVARHVLVVGQETAVSAADGETVVKVPQVPVKANAFPASSTARHDVVPRTHDTPIGVPRESTLAARVTDAVDGLITRPSPLTPTATQRVAEEHETAVSSSVV